VQKQPGVIQRHKGFRQAVGFVLEVSLLNPRPQPPIIRRKAAEGGREPQHRLPLLFRLHPPAQARQGLAVQQGEVGRSAPALPPGGFRRHFAPPLGQQIVRQPGEVRQVAGPLALPPEQFHQDPAGQPFLAQPMELESLEEVLKSRIVEGLKGRKARGGLKE
jgi:hypothetical protein